MQNFYSVPSNDGDVYLNAGRGFWSIVRPLNQNIVNYVVNPSFESGQRNFWHNYGLDNNAILTTSVIGYFPADLENAYSGSYALRATQNVAGQPYGVEYFPSNDDASLQTIPIASGANIYISAYIKACAGDTIQLRGTYDGVILPTTPDFISRTTSVIATGDWQRVQVYVTNQRTGPLDVGIIIRVIPAVGSPCNFFLVDAVSATDININDYFDGDTPDAMWNGVPFLSSSTIGQFSREYGEEIFLNDIGFDVISWTGAGMMAVINDTIPYGQGGGSYYNRTWPSQQRGLTLVGTISSCRSYKDAQKKHSRLIELMGLHRYYIDPQPFVLRYRITSCDCDASGILEIPVVYKAGLEGAITGLFSERISLQLDAYEEQFWRSPLIKSRLLLNNNTIVVCNNGTAPTSMRIFVEGMSVSGANVDFISVANVSLGSGIYMQAPPNVGFQPVTSSNDLIIGDVDKICGSAYLQNKTTGAKTNVAGNILRPASVPSEFVLLHGNNTIQFLYIPHAGVTPRAFVSYRERFLSSSDAWRLPISKACGATYDPRNFGDRC